MSAQRTIKKYPNRRLYDTELSRYITLSDVRNLVMEGIDFKIVDANSNEDLSRSVLLQIMLEEESGGEPLFTAAMLSQIIRFYGGSIQGVFARYLEESLTLFEQQQQQWRDAVGTDPMHAMTEIAQKNMKMWSDMHEDFLQTMGFGASPPDKKDKQ